MFVMRTILRCDRIIPPLHYDTTVIGNNSFYTYMHDVFLRKNFHLTKLCPRVSCIQIEISIIEWARHWLNKYIMHDARHNASSMYGDWLEIECLCRIYIRQGKNDWYYFQTAGFQTWFAAKHLTHFIRVDVKNDKNALSKSLSTPCSFVRSGVCRAYDQMNFMFPYLQLNLIFAHAILN